MKNVSILYFKSVVVIGILFIGLGCTNKFNKDRVATNQVVVTDTPTIAEKPVKEEWADASNTLKQGDIQLRVKKTLIDYVEINSFGKSKSATKLFIISLEITNLSDKKIMDYKGLATKIYTSLSEDVASLKDDNDNNYKRVHFGLGSRIEGQVHGGESIYPQKTLSDVIIFEPPVDVAKFVLLEIPASVFGGKGVFRIKISRNMWE